MLDQVQRLLRIPYVHQHDGTPQRDRQLDAVQVARNVADRRRHRMASVDSSFNQSTKLRISASMVLCVCSTPLARLGVAEGYKINFTLFGSGRFNGTFAGSRTNCSNDNSEESRGRTNTTSPSRGK